MLLNVTNWINISTQGSQIKNEKQQFGNDIPLTVCQKFKDGGQGNPNEQSKHCLFGLLVIPRRCLLNVIMTCNLYITGQSVLSAQ